MKRLKLFLLGSLSVYLLALTTCNRNQVEVIQGEFYPSIYQENYEQVIGNATPIHNFYK